MGSIYRAGCRACFVGGSRDVALYSSGGQAEKERAKMREAAQHMCFPSLSHQSGVNTQTNYGNISKHMLFLAVLMFLFFFLDAFLRILLGKGLQQYHPNGLYPPQKKRFYLF